MVIGLVMVRHDAHRCRAVLRPQFHDAKSCRNRTSPSSVIPSWAKLSDRRLIQPIPFANAMRDIPAAVPAQGPDKNDR